MRAEVSEGMRWTLLGVRGSGPCAQLEWRHGLSFEPRQRGAGHPRVHPQRGRLRGARRAPGGRGVDPRRRRRRRRRRGGQHLRLRRAGQEGLDRHAARGRRPQGDRAHQGRGGGGLPRRALRPDPRRRAAGCRRGARLRLLPRHVQPPDRHPRWSATGVPRAERPPDAAAPLAGRPLRGRRRRGPARARRRRRGLRALAARRAPVGAAEDRQRLRPALLVLRHPDVPRVLRLAPAHRRHRGGALAGGAWRARAVPRQRELDVLRQGPRRPRAAREAAARAHRRRGGRAGAGVLPAARRGAPGAARGDGRRYPASCRGTTCRSSTPRRPCCAGCAGSVAPSPSSS